MAGGNGDERQAAAWERVESKLDRQGERLDGIEARLGNVEDNVLKIGGRVDLLVRAVEATRQGLEAKLELAKLDLLDAMADVARGHALHARTSAEARVDALAGRLDEILARVEALEQKKA